MTTSLHSMRGCTWITGASSGLGRAVALRLARAGQTIVASARRTRELEALMHEASTLSGKIVALQLDVTDRAAANAAVDRIESEQGPIDIAILNAGSYDADTAMAVNADAVRATLDLNFMGAIHGLEALLPRMIARRRGRIVVVASVAGYRGLPYAAAYAASKAALIAYAEALRPELERQGVILQVANPGFVKTPLTDRNAFPMPFLMPVEAAAAALVKGLGTTRFEIVFPRRLAYLMKLLRILPYAVFFAITRRMVRAR